MALDNSKKKSILSFLYHIRFDPEISRNFKEAPGAIIAEFELSSAESDLLVELGDAQTQGGDADALWAKLLLEHLRPELRAAAAANLIW